ncbi:MAG TPA: hypothetical protein QGG47_10965 [Acidobacteriota bacterium]|nr:hypothetical protein [Acidobacteriota bacterium]
MHLADAVVAPEDRYAGALGRVRSALDILRFRAAAVDDAIQDEGAFPAAAAIASLAGIATAAAFGLSFAGHVGTSLAYLAGSFLFAGLIHLVAVIGFDAKRDFLAFYRPFGHTYLAFWIIGIPVIQAFFGWAIWLWQLAAVVFVAERVYGLDRVRAVALIAGPAVGALVAVAVFNGALAMIAPVVGWLL